MTRFEKRKRLCIGTVSVALLSSLLSGCGGDDNGSEAASTTPPTQAAQPLTCAQMAGMKVPVASIGLPSTGAVVTDATLVPASGSGSAAVGDYCLVSGNIMPVDPSAPNIAFQLALPTSWNAKIIMLGGGGFDGVIPAVTGPFVMAPATASSPLGRGYAVFGSDSGHQANPNSLFGGFADGSFSTNQEAYRNFAGDALKKTHDAAVYLIKARYAVASPAKAYFLGGSTGGREALTVLQRWPQDWDGVVALYPAWDFTALSLQQLNVSEAFAAPGAYLNPAKRGVLLKAVMTACDGLDGVVDGVISNVQACNATFNPSTATLNGVPLKCAGGADTGDTCLSAAQINALNTMNSPLVFGFTLASGETQYPGYNVWGADLGVPSTQPTEPTIALLGLLGSTAPVVPVTVATSGGLDLADAFIRYTVMADPNANSLMFNPADPGAWASRLSELSAEDAIQTDLSAFAARNGKLLLAHGTADALVSTRATEYYYQRVQASMGTNSVDNFIRFFELPGVEHGGISTVFNPAWDVLGTLENWVEKGVVPSAQNQIVTDTIAVPGRTRPLCPYPEWPKFNGTGDVNTAASFTCTATE